MKNDKQLLFERMALLNEDFTMKIPKVIITVGISGSGKSTWINANNDNETIVVSPDNIRRELSGDVSNQGNMGLVWKLTFERIVEGLNNGNDVILDATNLKSFERKKLKEYLDANVSREYEAYAKVFDVDPEITKQRIKKDIDGGVDRANVPPEAVDRQYQNFTSDFDKIEADGFKIIQ